VTDFRNDYRPLLARQSAVGDAAIDIARSLRNLDEAEMTTLGDLLTQETDPLRMLLAAVTRSGGEQPEKPLSLELIEALRAKPDESPEESLERTLDLLWTRVLKSFVESELRQMAPRK
jgi:hypothetical protein